MSEIEKIQKYIARTKCDKQDRYGMNCIEAIELTKRACESADFPLEVISLALNYGKAKGYRAAKAEARR